MCARKGAHSAFLAGRNERMSDRICVGAIAGAFGVRGEVRLKSYTSDPTDIALYAPLWTEDGKPSFSVTIPRAIPNGLAARLSGISTKEEADALKGVELFTDRDRLPSLPDDEFYHTDLIGLTVVDTGGTELGRVRAIYNHGAGDIIEVAGPRLLLLPFTRAVVPTVDLAAGRVVVDLPEDAG